MNYVTKWFRNQAHILCPLQIPKLCFGFCSSRKPHFHRLLCPPKLEDRIFKLACEFDDSFDDIRSRQFGHSQLEYLLLRTREFRFRVIPTPKLQLLLLSSSFIMKTHRKKKTRSLLISIEISIPESQQEVVPNRIENRRKRPVWRFSWSFICPAFGASFVLGNL